MRSRPAGIAAASCLALLAALVAWRLASGPPPAGPAGPPDPPVARLPPDAAPPPPNGAGTLEVEVLLGGRPCPAAVEVRPCGDRPGYRPARADPLRRAEAGLDGRAAFAAIPVGEFEVLARSAGGPSAATRVRVSPAGARVLARLDLPDGGCVLHGRAVTADGSPWRGLVAAIDSGTHGEHSLSGESVPVTTDAEGGFAISGLHPGLVLLRAVAPGAAEWTGGPFRVPAAGEVCFVVDAGAGPLSGRVLDVVGDQPVPGATVEFAGGGETREARCTGHTGDDGRFRVPRLSGHGRIRVTADGYTPADLAIDGDRTEIEIRIGRGAVVVGTVVAAEDGRPLPDCSVRATAEQDGSRADAVSEPDGAFRLPALPAGRLTLVALGPGRASRIEALHAARGEVREIRLVAEPAAVLVGAVLDETGAGLPGAPVRIDDLALETVSGDGGAFDFPALPPATPLRVSAFPAGRAEATAVVRTAGPGGTAHVVLRAAACRAVEVIAVEEGTEAPVAGALVTVSPLCPPQCWHHAFTGPDGVARFPALPAARSTVHVDAPDRALTDSVPDIPASPEDATVRVVLRETPGLRGRVLRADGTAAASARVTADRDGEPGVAAFSDETGAFRLLGLAPGRFIVDAVTERAGERGRVEAEAGAEDVIIRLCAPDPAGSPPALTFLVLDPEGRRVPSCEVVVETVDRSNHDYQATRLLRVTDGHAESQWDVHPGLEVTGYRVTDAQDASGLPLPLGDVTGGPVPGDAPATIEVRLPPERVIEGEVLAPDGAPVRGLRMRATGPAGEPLRTYQTFTDTKGRFRFGRLAAGNYRIRPVGDTTGEARVAAGTMDLVLRLAVEDVMTVRVVDPEGRPVPGARLEWGDTPATGPGDGVLLAVPFGPRESRELLRVLPPPDRPDLTFVRVPFVAGTETTLVLPRALFVRGFVREASGAGVPGIDLIGMSLGMGFAGVISARTASDGSFELGPFWEGPVTLRVPRAHPDLWSGLTREVAAGDEGVVLPWERGGTLVVRVRGGSGEEGGGRTVVLADEESGVTSGPFSLDDLDVYRFEDLPPDRSFTFCCRGPAGVAFLRGLYAGEDHSADMGPGLPLRVRLDGPAGLAATYALDLAVAGLELRLEDTENLPAEATFTALPDAAGELTIHAVVGGRQVSLRKPVPRGVREVEIDVTPR